MSFETSEMRGFISRPLAGQPPSAVLNPALTLATTFLHDQTTDDLWLLTQDLLGANTWVLVSSAGGGLTPATHETLRQLIHLADGVGGPMGGWPTGMYRETTPVAAVFPTEVIWWTSPAKLTKIVQKDLVYTGAFPTTIAWTMFAADGTTVLEQVIDVVTYVGAFEVSRVRTIL